MYSINYYESATLIRTHVFCIVSICAPRWLPTNKVQSLNSGTSLSGLQTKGLMCCFIADLASAFLKSSHFAPRDTGMKNTILKRKNLAIESRCHCVLLAWTFSFGLKKMKKNQNKTENNNSAWGFCILLYKYWWRAVLKHHNGKCCLCGSRADHKPAALSIAPVQDQSAPEQRF